LVLDEAESNRKASSPFAQRKDSPVYHCTTRCVRRAILLEEGKSNRKEWLENWIKELAEISAVGVDRFSQSQKGQSRKAMLPISV
jgi:hypothetical protein